MLHTGLGPEQALSGFMTQVIACAIQLGGMPVPRGGGVRLVEALAGIVREGGGELRTGADVERVLVAGGRATGVRLAGGETVAAARAVIAGVTPQQLYGRAPARGRGAAGRLASRRRPIRYGRAGMQIHLALDALPQWASPEAERLARTALLHVTPGLDGVSRAVNEAERGLLPAEATIVVGQPATVDPGRAPEGKSVIWIQLQELPRRPLGDALGEIDVGDGTWSEGLREAYADRIVERLGRQITNLGSATLKRVVLSPADLEGLNRNLVGGDIYAGSCALDQNLLWRPTGQLPGHAHGARRALADRRLHAPRARSRRRIRLSRGQAAAAPAAAPPGARARLRGGRQAARAPPAVKIALSEISTPGASFAEDVAAYAAAGFDGIGIWEFKLPEGDDDASLRVLRESGLGAANCVPAMPSLLQLALPGMEGPADPAERVEALCASMAPPGPLRAGLASCA